MKHTVSVGFVTKKASAVEVDEVRYVESTGNGYYIEKSNGSSFIIDDVEIDYIE